MAGNQVTDGDSGVEQTGPVSDEPHADSSGDAASKDQADQQGDQGVTADASTKAADAPRKPKSKGKDEPQTARSQKAADVPASDTKAPDIQPAAPVVSDSQLSKPKSLAEVLKVDLRARKKRRY